MGRFLESFGRFLDLLFPERVYRRKKQEETEAKLALIDEKADKLIKISTASEAIKSKRHKTLEELLVKVLERLEQVEKKLETVDKTTAESAKRIGNEVTAKQILSEYIYGEKGDE